MSGYVSMVQEVVEGLSRRGHSIEDRGPDWVLVEDENGHRFKISVSDEGSTPLDSPAQCGHGIAVAGDWLRCQNTPDHDGLHISGRSRWRTGGGLEPVPVPPPVDALLKLLDEYGMAAEDAGDSGTSSLYNVAAKETRSDIEHAIKALWAAGVEEGRRQQAGKVEELQVLLDHAEQYARDLQDNGDVPGRAEILTEAYWKLRDHASALRSTEVYRKASERKEGTLHESPAFQRYRWLEATARGIEDGAHDLAEMLGVEQHEIERPAADHG